MFLLICFIVFVEFTVTTAHPMLLKAETQSTNTNLDAMSSISKEFQFQYYVKANWYNAFLFCRNNGWSLATINSQEEHHYLTQLITDHGLTGEHFWISGSDLADESRFSWYSIGKLFNYTSWQEGEPNNAGEGEDCVEVNVGTRLGNWNDLDCNVLLPFVCEREY